MAENKTTLNYNEDETVLTIEVNKKPLNRYTFVQYPVDFDFEQADGACQPCVFFKQFGCSEIRCCKTERQDCTSGYFIISEQ